MIDAYCFDDKNMLFNVVDMLIDLNIILIDSVYAELIIRKSFNISVVHVFIWEFIC